MRRPVLPRRTADSPVFCQVMEGKKDLHERATNTMMDRYSDSVPTILMADRGYESFNVFAHLFRKDMKFVVRMKDINSNGIRSAYDLPDSEFDTYIRITLTRRHTKETLGNPNTYTIFLRTCDRSCRYKNKRKHKTHLQNKFRHRSQHMQGISKTWL